MLPALRPARAWVVGCLWVGAAAAGLRSQTPPPAASVFVDFVALDVNGRNVGDLGAGEVTVTIDGEPRPVRSLRYVFRGAGGEEAARLAALPAAPAADPSRTVVIAIDETSIDRGRERTAVSGVWRVIEGLTTTDRVGVTALPRPVGPLTIGVDRELWRRKLAGIRGRAVRPSTLPPTVAPADIASPIPPSRSQPDAGLEPAQREPERPSTGDQPTPEGRPDEVLEDAMGADRLGPLPALIALFEALRPLPGPKFVVYVAADGGGAAKPRSGPAETVTPVIAAAAAARASLHLVGVSDRDRVRPDPTLEELARRTGGTVSLVTPKRADLARLFSAVSGGYVVEVEERATDRDGRTLPVTVRTTRQGLRLLVAERWVPRDDPLPPLLSSALGDVAAGEPLQTQISTAPRGRGIEADPELDAVMARVASYVDAYLGELGNVVAEERYRQLVLRRTSRVSRTTKSDLLLIRTGSGWTPFRDVFEVDGTPVRDREERLKQLFLEHPETAMSEGRRISEESARYNIGAVYRTINTPLLGLSFFSSVNQWAFECRRHGVDTIDGVKTWRIDFEETGSPTQIQHATTLVDLPASGTLWVEPSSGRIVRTRVRVRQDSLLVEMTVNFRPNDVLGLWTPVRMVEQYRRADGAETIDGDATYSNFRRFLVDTAESLGPPR